MKEVKTILKTAGVIFACYGLILSGTSPNMTNVSHAMEVKVPNVAVSDTLGSTSSQQEKIRLDILSSSKRTQAEAQSLSLKIVDVAQKRGVDAILLASLIREESHYNGQAVSSCEAVGLGQLTPIAIADLGGNINPYDEDENLDGTARYLKKMLSAFHHDQNLAIAAYNAGPTIVKRLGDVPPYQETINYVKKVNTAYQSIQAK